MSMIGNIWYQYVDNPYVGEELQGVDISSLTPSQLVHLREFTVVAETAKTVVLVRSAYPQTHRHRVLKEARRRFAYPTKELALESYRLRKRYHVRILTHRLDLALACAKAARRITV